MLVKRENKLKQERIADPGLFKTNKQSLPEMN